ncbi:hypothetical protein [Fictibacillus barbaricus]|uniref:Uncharacterized protein n=1 Tax=Fictibacillus barbaricus TaxID=182136 RepID=A0ABU1U3N2_9BACL|nr:hypothetical protein [Fictibacillus barbaricus]MDR7074052.1 hypothetical protein [Fictibacillus barbaricus]
MNELLIFGELHKFLNSLGPMKCTIAPKSLSIGYKPLSLWGKTSKFATLYGDKRYECLILHVDPGKPDSTKGKEIQKEIQKLLNFDISELRSFKLKKHEAFVPLELLKTNEAINLVKNFVSLQYEQIVTNKN